MPDAGGVIIDDLWSGGRIHRASAHAMAIEMHGSAQESTRPAAGCRIIVPRRRARQRRRSPIAILPAPPAAALRRFVDGRVACPRPPSTGLTHRFVCIVAPTRNFANPQLRRPDPSNARDDGAMPRIVPLPDHVAMDAHDDQRFLLLFPKRSAFWSLSTSKIRCRRAPWHGSSGGGRERRIEAAATGHASARHFLTFQQ